MFAYNFAVKLMLAILRIRPNDIYYIDIRTL